MISEYTLILTHVYILKRNYICRSHNMIPQPPGECPDIMYYHSLKEYTRIKPDTYTVSTKCLILPLKKIKN